MRRIARALLLVAVALAMLPRPLHAEGPMPLSAYPRPPADRGRGIHWAPTVLGQSTEMVDRYVDEAVAMGMTWVKVMQGDAPKLEHDYLIERLAARGIMPVLRIFRAWNEPYEHLDAIVRLGVPAGIHYYELHNEPNLSGEAGGWRPGEAISVERIATLWIAAADTVTRAGGLPGLPALAPGGDYDDLQFLRAFLAEIERRGRTDLMYRAWLPLHNYFLNHPVDYPYDEVNLRSVPLTQDEIVRRGLTAEQASRIDEARRISRLPRSQGGYYVGDNIHADSNGFLKFQAYARILEEEFGFVIPIITTEGGAIIGSAEDPRYAAIDEADLVQRTLAAFAYLESQAPPYYFAFMPWLMANRAGGSPTPAWEGAAWYREDGSTLAVVPALKQQAAAAPARAAATQVPTPAPVAALPTAAVRAVDADAGPVTLRRVLRVPDIAAALEPSTPASPSYPLPLLKTGDVPARDRECEVVVLRSDALEAWIVPELGARLLRLTDLRSGQDLLSPVAALSFQGAGAVHLAGGPVWLYPSPALPLVDAVPWQLDASASGGSQVRLTRHEARSRTSLALTVALGAEGTLHLRLVASNGNGETRLVGAALAGVEGLPGWSLRGPAAVALAPGGSQEWEAVWAPAGAVAATPTSPPPAASRDRAPALATPIPYGSTPPAPASPTAGVPAATVAPPPSGASALAWDPRLTDLGITLAANPGGRWQLVEAVYEDDTQSGGQHLIVMRLLPSGSQSCQGPVDRPWVSWPDGRHELELKEGGSGCVAEFPMYGLLGSYAVGVGSDGDSLQGLGLPAKHHVNYRLTFRQRY